MTKPFYLLAAFTICASPVSSNAVSFDLHAKTWNDFGRVMNSSDTLITNFNGNWQQTMGMQIYGIANLGDNFEGGFGFGLTQVYHSLGNETSEKFTLSKFFNYVSDARITYTLGEKPNPLFSATVGDFAFNYNPEVKNLGLYLFRGPVYPGFLVSGFKEFHTDTTRAAFLGLHLHNGLGNFQQDLVLYDERDLPPSFDWSLGYVAKYKAFNALEIGAGVNFYHLMADNAKITSPTTKSSPALFAPDYDVYQKDSALIAAGGKVDPYQLQYMEVMAPGDTVFYTHHGTKVMAMFNLDIKNLLGLSEPFGAKDLILYGEGALVGVKNYGSIYAKRNDRIPVMVGFNFPAFGLLDLFSVEVEHYTAKYRPDYGKLGFDRSLYFKNIAPSPLTARDAPSAIPMSLLDVVNSVGTRYQITPDGNLVETQTGKTIPIKGTALDPENFTADDWKWSLNVEKTFARHVQFSGQIANDHFIPRPVRSGLINESSGLSEVLTGTKDWYFMARVGYFF
jgi:hypothetical protein